MGIPLSFQVAFDIINRWNSYSKINFMLDRDFWVIDYYLEAVDVIQQSVSLPGYQSQSKDAIRMAVARLKLEFQNIMIGVTIATKGSSSTYLSSSENPSLCSTNMSSSTTDGTTTSYEINTVSLNSPSTAGAISRLSCIAKRMNLVGYVGECFEVYKSVRMAFLETSLKQLGIEKLSARDTQGLFFEEFKKKIDQLIHAAEVCYWILFRTEMKFCSQIFDGIKHDSCFSETIKDAEIQLMNFAEAVITSRRSPEKLFKILDLSKRLSNDWLLEGAPVQRSNDKIGEVVRAILSDFEKSVAYELSTISEPSGTVHFLTKYVIDYVNLMVSYKSILSDFIVSNPSTTFGDLVIPDVEFAQLEERGETLALHLVLIIVVLRFKLEEKSKYYKDTTLAHLFVANNLHYIVQVIKESVELKEMIGEEYMNKLSYYIRQAISNYQSSTCERMLYCLRDEEDSLCFSSRGTFRRRVRSFNATFEKIRSTQARWVVQNFELREELRLSIVEKVTPAYASFLERFNKRIEGSKYPHIKYSVEDLHTLIIKDFLRTL